MWKSRAHLYLFERGIDGGVQDALTVGFVHGQEDFHLENITQDISPNIHG